MAEQPTTSDYLRLRFDAIAADSDLLTSDHPQKLYEKKLRLGIEEVGPGLVMIRRMADVQALTRSHAVRQFGSNGGGSGGTSTGRPGDIGLGGHFTAIPLELNGTEQTKWRKVLDPVFAPKRIAVLEPRIRARAIELIDSFIERGEADAYEEWCDPLPSSIFLSIMGIPQTERKHFVAFKNIIITQNPLEPAAVEDRDAAYSDCEQWFSAEFGRRIRGGDFGDDLIGWLMQTEVDGQRLTREELLGICNLLMIAGLDTVAASLSCILAHLARNPERRRAILEEPSSWPAAIEELMRFETPVTQGLRHVKEDVELPSGTIRAGTNAVVWWAAANMDPDTFDEPMEVRLDRRPNPHVCFGSGWHRCLGSHLARMELRVALDAWHQRIPDYRLKDPVDLQYSVNPRAPHRLPLVWNIA